MGVGGGGVGGVGGLWSIWIIGKHAVEKGGAGLEGERRSRKGQTDLIGCVVIPRQAAKDRLPRSDRRVDVRLDCGRGGGLLVRHLFCSFFVFLCIGFWVSLLWWFGAIVLLALFLSRCMAEVGYWREKQVEKKGSRGSTSGYLRAGGMQGTWLGMVGQDDVKNEPLVPRYVLPVSSLVGSFSTQPRRRASLVLSNNIDFIPRITVKNAGE